MDDYKYEIVKFINNNIELDVNVSPKEETVLLSLEEMATLYDRDRSVIGKHIKKIFNDKELEESTCRAKFARHLEDGRIYQIDYYNLDVIISVGYRVNSKKGTIFRKWATSILKEYLLKGYSINENRVTVSNENYIELKNEVLSINTRLAEVENKINKNEVPIEKIFFDGEFYDAYALIQDIFIKANNEIIIIDNYIDRTILDRLVVKKKNVNVIIYHDLSKSRLLALDVKAFNKQYGGLSEINTIKTHDRYIIIDKQTIYHIGASLKDLGKKAFSISQSNSGIIDTLISNL
ncbi:MAG: RhuM family protein [Bacilli bacterium]|nr:RhuM family protein [Bacilli bacterium]